MIRLNKLLIRNFSSSNFYRQKDFYQILEVSRIASDKEIKQAFRTKAIKYHPDKIKALDTSDDAEVDPVQDAKIKSEQARYEKIFKEISEAYETLSDPVLRRKYDELNPLPFEGKNRKSSAAGLDPKTNRANKFVNRMKAAENEMWEDEDIKYWQEYYRKKYKH